MIRSSLAGATAVATLILSLTSIAAIAAEDTVATAPPDVPYKAVSTLVTLPDFIPGLGQLFVDPDTLPAGPFLGYDHDGQLVSTTYMIPLSMINEDFNLTSLDAPAATV